MAGKGESPGLAPGLFDTTELSESGVHRSGSGVSHVGEHVRVDVEGERDVGVPQKLLDVLGVHALPQQQRGAGVSEVVGDGAGPSTRRGAP